MTVPSLIWPVPGYYEVSSGYFDSRDYGLHGAIDISAPAVPTVGVGAGTIIWWGWAGSAGRSVWLDLPGGYRVHYCHLSSINVSVGQQVGPGDKIGLVGGSGHGVDNYFGSHLHLNLFFPEPPPYGPSHWVGWVGKYAVDPELYLGKGDVMASGFTSEQETHLAQLRLDLMNWLKDLLVEVRQDGIEYTEGEAERRHQAVMDAVQHGGTGGGSAGPRAFHGTVSGELD